MDASPGEAETAAAAGADALCVQGYEAGAHRGTFVNDDAPGRDLGLLSLIGEVAAITGLPQIAAGGIMGPRQVRAVLAAGAVAAQCGTAFLRCPESGAHPLYKAALADPRYTATTLTRAFSGRPAAAWSTSSSSTTWTRRRLPGDQQRDPPAAGRGRGQRRHRADVAVGGTGLPPAAELPAAEIIDRLSRSVMRAYRGGAREVSGIRSGPGLTDGKGRRAQ